MRLWFQTNASDILRRFDRWPSYVQTSILKALKRHLMLMEGKVKQRADIKARRGSSGLMGRLTSYARVTGNDHVDAAIGFRKTRGFPYEYAQEFGARAKAGGAMAIPMSPIARALSERSGGGPSPRQLGIALFRPRGTNVLLEARQRSTVLHYVLVKAIKPRLHFRRTVTQELTDLMGGVERAFVQATKST